VLLRAATAATRCRTFDYAAFKVEGVANIAKGQKNEYKKKTWECRIAYRLAIHFLH
jgi:hypothetical protein